ncbi:MAG TPA: MBL fold metallo-hydrolase [Solirubrobacteraceae bacterium]
MTSEEGQANEPDEEELLGRATEAGIHRLAIPTPFQVGRVNAYLIEDSPLTLIDSGPSSERSLLELEQGLAARGHAVEDIELLVITHQHVDHFGLAATLARRSGAEVAALDGLVPYLREFETNTELDDRFAQRVMLRHGIPDDVIEALRTVSASFRTWGAAVEVTRPLRDGERLCLRDRSLRVLHRPGHSPSDTVFVEDRAEEEEEDRSENAQGAIMFSGDHLLANISSNPLLARPLGAGPDFTGPRPRALIDYIASLERTRAMDLSLVLGGHGPPIADHSSLVELRLSMHRRRAERIHGLIADRPLTAHEIAVELWGNVAVTQAYLTLSEVLGHVDLLQDEGRAVERVESEADVVRFAAV